MIDPVFLLILLWAIPAVINFGICCFSRHWKQHAEIVFILCPLLNLVFLTTFLLICLLVVLRRG